MITNCYKAHFFQHCWQLLTC